MSKVRLPQALLFVSALLIIFTGCKKDDGYDIASFELTGETSIHFEYGQEKVIGFESNHIQKFGDPEKPDGWLCTIDKSKSQITITAPAEPATKLNGEIEIKATTNTGSELELTITVAIMPAKDLGDPANCYIVSKPDQRYKFDARRKGNQSSGLAPVDVKLVWTTVKDAISNITLEDGFVYFATDDTQSLVEANALIAALDKDENIIWSWHIWCVDYDPASETVMSRNLGAFKSSNASAEDAFASCGLYYQWGRKDPFVGSVAWNSTRQQAIYASNTSTRSFSLSYVASSSSEGTIEYATANPTHFIVGVEKSKYDWLYASRNNGLWTTADGKKTEYDPCPAGWKVASPSIWASFTTTGHASSVESEFKVENQYEAGEWYGWEFTDGGYYPAAGRRSFSKTEDNFSNATTGDPVGFYWANTNSDVNGAFLSFKKDYVNPDSTNPTKDDEFVDNAYGARAGGFPLRCVKE